MAAGVAIALVENLLSFDPQQRMTCEQILAHPYLAALHDPNDEVCPPGGRLRSAADAPHRATADLPCTIQLRIRRLSHDEGHDQTADLSRGTRTTPGKCAPLSRRGERRPSLLADLRAKSTRPYRRHYCRRHVCPVAVSRSKLPSTPDSESTSPAMLVAAKRSATSDTAFEKSPAGRRCV